MPLAEWLPVDLTPCTVPMFLSAAHQPAACAVDAVVGCDVHLPLPSAVYMLVALALTWAADSSSLQLIAHVKAFAVACGACACSPAM